MDHLCNIKVERTRGEGFGSGWTTASKSRTLGDLFCKGHGYVFVPKIRISWSIFEALRKVLMSTEWGKFLNELVSVRFREMTLESIIEDFELWDLESSMRRACVNISGLSRKGDCEAPLFWFFMWS